jgi:hypothetical protein
VALNKIKVFKEQLKGKEEGDNQQQPGMTILRIRQVLIQGSYRA